MDHPCDLVHLRVGDGTRTPSVVDGDRRYSGSIYHRDTRVFVTRPRVLTVTFDDDGTLVAVRLDWPPEGLRVSGSPRPVDNYGTYELDRCSVCLLTGVTLVITAVPGDDMIEINTRPSDEHVPQVSVRAVLVGADAPEAVPIDWTALRAHTDAQYLGRTQSTVDTQLLGYAQLALDTGDAEALANLAYNLFHLARAYHGQLAWLGQSRDPLFGNVLDYLVNLASGAYPTSNEVTERAACRLFNSLDLFGVRHARPLHQPFDTASVTRRHQRERRVKLLLLIMAGRRWKQADPTRPMLPPELFSLVSGILAG
jgi:hypothetical protein